MVRVSCNSPALDAAYGPSPPATLNARADSTLTIVPGRPVSTMRCAVPRATRHAPSRLVPTTAAQSSSVTSSVEAGRAIPELFTRMSGVPSTSRTVSSAWPTLCASVTSIRTGCATPPVSRISRAAASSRPVRRAASATDAPCAARVPAKWRPRPLDAPVTSAVRPLRSKVGRCGIADPVGAGIALRAAHGDVSSAIHPARAVSLPPRRA